MKYYRIYGLGLTVNIALPGPISIDSLPSDLPIVDVVLGELPSWLTETPDRSGIPPNWYECAEKSDLVGSETVPLLQVWQVGMGQYFYCRYHDETTFVINRLGTQIWATWPDDLTLEDTAVYLLGPILGFVLRLRGTVCLHANAIAIGDRVVVLVGAAGAGKSTTAAAFAQQGYAILSDDVVPIIDRGDNFLIEPAYPRIRLWDSSVRALYSAADALPRLVPTHPTWDKRYLDLSQTGYKFQTEPLPLAAIYYLNERSDNRSCPCVAPMTTQEQLITLVTNTYTNYLLDKSLRAQEFEFLSRVVKYIPVRQITPHTDIARLDDLIDTIVSDFPV
ncbi:hypothetical protein [Chamaesiphon sp. VAR_48_metabat_135_sub]|uniref:hypothetical protein n=1 Tax=Chamaesiphon sp. VAR_48_metabat_135_sub TaxID=2964699 RepID=UPI00286A9FC1|nr:hypothetical protein [Chamaesiphon sp. VAR_48_metabat_135_sub]